MLETLPKILDPYVLAKKHELIQGVARFSELTRLSPQLSDLDGQAQYELSFNIDSGRQPYVKGSVSAELHLVCQRCMQPMNYPVKAQFLLAVIKNSDAIKTLSSQYEPLIVKDNESINILDIIEEELLLNLPIVAKHSDCPL